MSNATINVNVQAAFEGFREYYHDNNMGQDGYTEMDCIAYACEDLTELVYTAQTGQVHGPKGADGWGAAHDATRELNDVLAEWDSDVAGWYNVYVGSFVVPTETDRPHDVVFVPRWLKARAATQYELGDIVINVWTDGDGWLTAMVR